ncbi:MAG TPA: phosphatase PAP2 family protein [Terriglobales bacterium]|nr:phosphatase PAP2 family protein [Terriglobales bacterium]
MMRLRHAAAALAFCATPLSAAASPPWAILGSTTRRLALATTALPHAAIVHWRVTLPLAAGTAALIAFGDHRLSDQIQSPSLERSSRNWSDRGLLYIEPAFVLTAAAVEDGCLFCHETGRFALVALTAEAYNTAAVQAIKFSAGRERPYTPGDPDGGFNESGSSFPSGHAVGAFTMAALLAQHDPQAAWFNRGAWLLAGGVSGLRFTAKEHFPSDLLVGAALGAYLGAHALPAASPLPATGH